MLMFAIHELATYARTLSEMRNLENWKHPARIIWYFFFFLKSQSNWNSTVVVVVVVLCSSNKLKTSTAQPVQLKATSGKCCREEQAQERRGYTDGGISMMRDCDLKKVQKSYNFLFTFIDAACCISFNHDFRCFSNGNEVKSGSQIKFISSFIWCWREASQCGSEHPRQHYK